MPPRELITIQEARILAHVNRGAIYRWRKEGKIESKRYAGGKVRIFLDSLVITPKERAADLKRRKTLSFNDACCVLGICRVTLLRNIRKGRIDYVQMAGGRFRVFEDFLEGRQSTFQRKNWDTDEWGTSG